MVKKLIFMLVIIIFISACQQDSSDNKGNIQEGKLNLTGASDNW
ncbi:hypothetical protein ACLIA0_13620 [Bacillaceae bacterium W0354]